MQNDETECSLNVCIFNKIKKNNNNIYCIWVSWFWVFGYFWASLNDLLLFNAVINSVTVLSVMTRSLSCSVTHGTGSEGDCGYKRHEAPGCEPSLSSRGYAVRLPSVEWICLWKYICVCISWWGLKPEYTQTHGDSCHGGDLNWGPHGYNSL